MFFFLQHYFLFIAITFLFYYSVANQYRLYVLCLASIVFAAVFSLEAALFALLFAVANYYSGILLERFYNQTAVRRKLFWGIVFFDVGILSFFKYEHFFAESINSLYAVFHVCISQLVPLIPIGLSYFTFQALGYVIRINRRSEKAERNFAAFVTYLLFFPKFLSGPVERSNHFLPQIRQKAELEWNTVFRGLRLFLWGLFKKVVIADGLYGPLSQVYQHVHAYTGLSLVIVLLFQTIYIYADFSGYTDMALGSAKLFGINLGDNFNRPFLARSVSEYWKRWHISLSSWCNDFIYNPFIVKYRRFGNGAAIPGLFLTFFIVGIWHGANMTFVVLGLLQGIAIVYEYYTRRFRIKQASRFRKKPVETISRLLVFLFMSVSMVFFFSNSTADAWYFISHLFTGIHFDWSVTAFIDKKTAFIFALFFFAVMFTCEVFIERGKDLLAIYLEQPGWIRWAGYLACLLAICLSGSKAIPFYYMRF